MTLLVALAALALKPLLPQPASCIYAVKPPPHMPRHCCESEQSRCSTPAQGLIMALCQLTHLDEDTCRALESGSSDCPSDGTAGLRRGLVVPLLDDARRAGKTVRDTTKLSFLFAAFVPVAVRCRRFLPGAFWFCAMRGRFQIWYRPVSGPAAAPRGRICRRPTGRR